MGVKLDFFCCVGAELQDFKFGQETNSRLYFYRAFESQTIDDMLEPGFFNEAQDLRVGDLILLYAPNQNRGYAFAKVISTTNGIVSTQSIGLKAQDVAVDTDELDNLTGKNLQKIIEIADTKITELKGAGGALTAYNFNTATPTQETLTKYAVDQIWPGNTNWLWNAANPAASVFANVYGSHTVAEISNATWVNNTYDGHRWQLTNTQNTTPKVFEWADVGRDIVAVATATTAGIVRVGSDSQMVVNPTTGDISLDGTKAESIRGTIGAVATNQGTANAGKVLTVGDDGNIELADGASGAGRNIGDIFWTTRTDSALNGAVEANGAQYNFADVNGGDNNVQALLVSGALPSVSIAEFDAMVAEQGGCDSFGYGVSNSSVVEIYAWGASYSISPYPETVYTTTDNPIEEDIVYELSNGVITKLGTVAIKQSSTTIRIRFENDTEIAGWNRQTGSDTTAELVQLSPTTYFKVPKKLSRVLVRTQKPTAANNYTWYNIYADGWCEQGGRVTANGNYITVSLPITMLNDTYWGQSQCSVSSGNTANLANFSLTNRTTTSCRVYGQVAENSIDWQIKGYAAASEYTKDKWDYQNVQVERPMVQLFNSATDEAVATCTEVLSDVADLKDLSNITATGKETVVGWGMPDYSAIIIASLPYTAPTDGYIVGWWSGDGNIARIDGVGIGATPSNSFGSVQVLISKNSVFSVAEGASETNFRFCPLKGVSNA